ncbi:MAG: SDR family NAD(P)-dependent oxidoreductase [Hamadaea sp.]|uniref:SDR family NAD(P)-dependent oxidoreductase n=1 Tax=Hamadaea sp. TaxID=2024425 RepID=UPI0017E05039|nr:SDR family NAD(P)-dependent oxidoreductase [Hamadaea sp.]NUR71261.1 SDR family NAD(P)-dependent oxidoreductase [Hamadaea sp.]NUT23135.1 SDR family NAD(P)-dependent oxidoreductase [Hamadaea sp.]
MEDLTAPTAVVTGASSGVGRAAAVEFARRGWRVALVGRDHDRLTSAFSLVRDQATGPEPIQVRADFADFASVREAALELAKLDRIDVLANNAGIVAGRRQTTVDGHELTIQTNHLSPFLLTALLKERIPAGGRIISTASMAHSWGMLRPDDLDRNRGPWSAWLTYGASKAANILFAAEAARRWPDLLSFSFHPGVIRSNFGTPLAKLFFQIAPGLSTPEQGADTLVYLATAPADELVDGAYYSERKVLRPKAYLADEEFAARFWEASERAIDG